MGDSNPDWTELEDMGDRVVQFIEAQPKEPETILDEAARLTSRDRQGVYGHPRDDFAKIVGGINGVFGERIKKNVMEGRAPISVEMWPLMMVIVKLARLENSPQHRDSKVDVAGYINTYDMLKD